MKPHPAGSRREGSPSCSGEQVAAETSTPIGWKQTGALHLDAACQFGEFETPSRLPRDPCNPKGNVWLIEALAPAFVVSSRPFGPESSAYLRPKALAPIRIAPVRKGGPQPFRVGRPGLERLGRAFKHEAAVTHRTEPDGSGAQLRTTAPPKVAKTPKVGATRPKTSIETFCLAVSFGALLGIGMQARRAEPWRRRNG